MEPRKFRKSAIVYDLVDTFDTEKEAQQCITFLTLHNVQQSIEKRANIALYFCIFFLNFYLLKIAIFFIVNHLCFYK